MDRTEISHRLIQVAILLAAAVAISDLLEFIHDGVLDGIVCILTAGLLVAYAFTARTSELGRAFAVLHPLAAVNVGLGLIALWSKTTAQTHDFHAHSAVYPLAAYLLYFARFSMVKFTRENALFGLGLSSLVAVTAFAAVSVLFQLFAPQSEFLNVKIEAMPLSSALLVLLASGYSYVNRYLSQKGSARQTMLLLIGLAFLGTAGALTVRKVLLESMFEVEFAGARTFAEISAHRIENELANLSEAVDRMADRIATGAYPDIDAWQLDADNYVSGFESLTGLGWMDESFRFVQAAPAEILPRIQVVGPDFNPIRQQALLQAAESQEVLLSPPFIFQDGMRAQVSMLAPIVQNGQTIGMLGNALNLEGLFSEISREVGERFSYAVTDGEQLVFASGEVSEFRVSSFIFAMNRRWVLTVPVDGTSLVEAYIWGQRFALSRLLAFVVIIFAVERARLAKRNNVTLVARNAELMRAQKVMSAQEDEISLMRSSLAHDLKSPIRNIRTVTRMWDQLKEAKGLTDSDLRDRILDNLTRLEKLSVSFTDFLAARVAAPDPKPESLAVLLNDVRDRFSDRCAITVEVDGAAEIQTDRMLLGRVFDNLVENSINAADKDDLSASITVQDMGGRYRIVYRDNGRGIPENLRERIFNPFDTGDGQRRPDSSGLGLTIVRRLVGNLDGNVACIDPGPQGGAAFMIDLPKAPLA